MKHHNVSTHPILHFVLNTVYAAALVLASLLTLLQPVYADSARPPVVPAAIQVPAGNKLFFIGHAEGTQNYICLPSSTGVKFTLFTPQATLFNEGEQVMTHYFSANPFEGGTIRATWQHSRDTSTVWGQVKDGNTSSDPIFVEAGAIPWLLVTMTGTQVGPTGGDKLVKTTFIQRINTSGGAAPATGCTTTAELGNRAFVPYTADYYFYKKSN